MIAFRVAYRSAGYWTSATFAVVATVLLFALTAEVGFRGAGYLPTAGLWGPETFLSSHGQTVLALFMVTLVFSALGVVDCDEREGIADALGARPWANSSRLVGRCFALAMLGWLPLLAAFALIQTLGFVAGGIQLLGGPLDLVPFVVFVLLDAPPALMCWSGLLVVLAIWLRRRFAVAFVALSLVAIWLHALSRVPAYLLPVFSPVTWHGELTSAKLPNTPYLEMVLRSAAVAVGAGAAMFAAGWCKRSDGRRTRNSIVGTSLALVGIVVILAVAADAARALDLRGQWLVAHRTASLVPTQMADLEHVAGVVRVSPGRDLHVDVRMRLRRMDKVPMSGLVLALNPGMTIQRLLLGESEPEYSHELGLLRVEVPAHLREMPVLTLSIRANGVPDPAFAYLDDALDWRTQPGGGPLAFLGREASLFDRRYVALMPEVRWLPAVGPSLYGNGSHDLFTMDLVVETPPSWLAAGPGLRTTLGPGRFRFNPAAPVANIAIFAAEFERLAVRVGGVEVELLVLGDHLDDIEGFEDAVPLLTDWFEGLLLQAQADGLPYPYGVLSLVDVPSRLRTYDGGWRMDTVQSLPGIQFVREENFRNWRSRRVLLRSSEPSTKVRLLQNYWRNDSTGGDPVRGLMRNNVSLQMTAHGHGALAANFLIEALASRLLSREVGGFSAFDFIEAVELTALIEDIYLTSLAFDLSSGSTRIALSEPLPAVWERALATPLVDLDPGVDPRQALAVLRLKCGRLADLVVDVLGRQGTAKILAGLRKRHSGSAFDLDNLIGAIRSIDDDLGSDLDHGLSGTALPGYRVSEADVFRLSDDSLGRPRYQVLFDLRNEERVPGWVSFQFGRAMGGGAVMYDGDPIRIDASSSVEVGLVSRIEPNRLFVQPYLSLNRGSLHVDLDSALEHFHFPPPQSAAFAGSRPSSWRPVPAEGLIVDDLDAGFTILGAADTDYGYLLDGARRVPDRDQGVPAYRPSKLRRTIAAWHNGLPVHARAFSSVTDFVRESVEDRGGERAGAWYRQESPSAWGRYRHTLVRTRAGEGRTTAVFRCDLPVSGRWRLDYHIPDLALVAPAWRSRSDVAVAMVPETYDQGSLRLRVVTADREVEVDLERFIDPRGGWKFVGEFAMPRGRAEVAVSDQSNGPIVVADAIRWRNVDSR